MEVSGVFVIIKGMKSYFAREIKSKGKLGEKI
jgi:hypothetical protein